MLCFDITCSEEAWSDSQLPPICHALVITNFLFLLMLQFFLKKGKEKKVIWNI